MKHSHTRKRHPPQRTHNAVVEKMLLAALLWAARPAA